MKTRRLFWMLPSTVVLLLAVGLGLPAGAVGPTTVIPIPTQEGARPVPEYIGHEAMPNPIASRSIPDNPHMSPGSWGAVHDDTYMSDTYLAPGPLGKEPITVTSASFVSLSDKGERVNGFAGLATVDSAGRLVVSVIKQNLVTGVAWAQLNLLDPDSLESLAKLDLPSKVIPVTQRLAGMYFYQDNLERTVIGTPNRTVWVVTHTCDPLPCSFTPLINNPDPNDPDRWAYNLNAQPGADAGIPAGDDIEALQPDFAGRLWFTSRNGVVGNLDPATGKMLGSIQLPGERIVNGSAADEDGGVYVVSTAAMYRFDAGADGAPVITWREPYDAGTHLKAGQVDIGSGTTPTLMGEDYVTISDNAQPQMNVLVYRRAKQVRDSRLFCAVPVFKPGPSSNENSLIATDSSIVVENNYGYKSLKSTQHGQTTRPGMARIDVDANGCHIVWTNTEVSIPSVVSKMSLATGLIYTYSKPKGPATTDPWYFTALDFRTGEVVFQQLTGTGLGYDNFYAQITIGRDGAAYVGVTAGIVEIRDRR